MSRTIQIDMTNGPILNKLIIFSLPFVLMNLLQIFFNMADVAVMGIFVSDEAVAAVGSNSALINLIISLFVGMSLASNMLISKSIGRNQQEKIYRLVGTSIILSIVAGVILGIFGFLMAKPLLQLINCAPEVIDLATIYVKIYFLGMPVIMLYDYCAAIMRATGDTIHPLIFIAISGVINIILNVVLVTVFKLTVEGVAIATVVSQAFAAIASLITIIKTKGKVKLKKGYFRFYKKELLELLKIGIPSGIQSSVFSISNMIIQSSINSFGYELMTANTIAGTFDNFMFQIGYSISIASISFASQNYGAGKVDRIKKTMFVSMGIVTFTGITIYALILIFGSQLCGIMTKSQKVIELAMIRLRFMSPMYIICNYMNIFGNICIGVGKPNFSLIVSVLGSCILRILYIDFILPLNRTVLMLYLVYPISWLATCFIYIIALSIIFKNLSKTIKKEMSKDDNENLEKNYTEKIETVK